MEKSVSDKLSTSIVWASVILAISIIYAASIIKTRIGRYTFTPQIDQWVLIGDTKTGKSWSCVSKALYDDESLKSMFSDYPKGFGGCLEFKVPSKIQKQEGYE